MKTVEVSIKAEFVVPDDWEVVDYIPDPDFPLDVRQVLKVEDRLYDFFPECLVKVEEGEMVVWSADEGRTDEIIDCMEGFEVDIRESEG